MKQFFYILAFIFLLNAPSVYCMLVSSDDYKRELQKFNTELQRSPATAQDALSSLEKSWEEAKAVFETDTLQDIASALGAQSNQTADTFMNNLLSDLKKRLAAARSSRGSAGPSASASVPVRPATPPFRPVATLTPASSFAVRPSAPSVSAAPSAAPTPSVPVAPVVVRPNLSSVIGALPVSASETNFEVYKQAINKLGKELESNFPLPAGAGREAAQAVETVWDIAKKLVSLINQAAEKIATNKLSELVDLVSDRIVDKVVREITFKWPGINIPDGIMRMFNDTEEKIATRMSLAPARPASPVRTPSPVRPAMPPVPSLHQLVLDASEPKLNDELSYDTDVRTYEKEIGDDLHSANLHSDIAANNETRPRYYLEEKVWLNIKKAIYAFSNAVTHVEPNSVLRNMLGYEQINQAINKLKTVARDKGYSVEIPAETLRVLQDAQARMQNRLNMMRVGPSGANVPVYSSYSVAPSASSSVAAQNSPLVLDAIAVSLPADAARYNFDQYVKELRNSLSTANAYINLAINSGSSTSYVLQDVAWPNLKKAIYFFNAAVNSAASSNPLALLDLPDIQGALNAFKRVATEQRYQANIPENVLTVLSNAQNLKEHKVQHAVGELNSVSVPAASAAPVPAQPVESEPELKDRYSTSFYITSETDYKEYEELFNQELNAVAMNLSSSKTDVLGHSKFSFERAWEHIYILMYFYKQAVDKLTNNLDKLPKFGESIQNALNEFEKELRVAGYRVAIPASVIKGFKETFEVVQQKVENQPLSEAERKELTNQIYRNFEQQFTSDVKEHFEKMSFKELVKKAGTLILAALKNDDDTYTFIKADKLANMYCTNNSFINPVNGKNVQKLYVLKNNYSAANSCSIDLIGVFTPKAFCSSFGAVTFSPYSLMNENIAESFNERLRDGSEEPVESETYLAMLQSGLLDKLAVIDTGVGYAFYKPSNLMNFWHGKTAFKNPTGGNVKEVSLFKKTGNSFELVKKYDLTKKVYNSNTSRFDYYEFNQFEKDAQ